jgi:DNA repair exonuclease SbcCD ATPase subunit
MAPTPSLQGSAPDRKTQILDNFQALLTQRQSAPSKVATRQDEADKDLDRQIVTNVTQYTTETLVRGLTDLQVAFGQTVGQLAQQLSAETQKLQDLQRAIAVEQQHLDNVRQTRIVADALYILNQEHQENLQFLETRIAQAQESLTEEQAATQKIWQREQSEFEQRIQAEADQIAAARQSEEADYQYTLEQKRKLATDTFEERQRQIQRNLRDRQLENDKNWANREAVLQAHQTQLQDYRQRVANFPQELESAIQKARESGIKESHDAAQVRANLLAKEWEIEQQNYELRIQALESQITQQVSDISQISAQLETAMRQAQELAIRAFGGSAQP